MKDPRDVFDEPETEDIKAERETLFLLTLAPATWAIHFVLCYATAAVWCARIAGRDGSTDGPRLLIAAYTVVALALIALTGWKGWRRHSYGHATAPHDFDTAADRHRFLGFSTLLLAALSIVATLFVAMPALFVETCR